MTAPATCARCGEEVRYGWRAGRSSIEQQRIPQPPAGFWMHRDPDADHQPVFGQASWMTDWAAVAQQRELYAEEDSEESAERTWEIPEPEVTATPIAIGDPRLPQGAKNKLNLAAKNGWAATAHYSRAARVHGSHGNFLGMSDYVVLRFRLDAEDRIAVGCWQDGKMAFAYTGTVDRPNRKIIAGRAKDSELKAWLKNEEET